MMFEWRSLERVDVAIESWLQLEADQRLPTYCVVACM